MPGSVSEEPFAEHIRERAESTAWARFVAADDRTSFCTEWLNLLAVRLDDARAGMLVVAAHDDAPFELIAGWPDLRRDLRYLGPAAERALVERQGIVADALDEDAGASPRAVVAYPIEVAGRLRGAVAFDVGSRDLQPALRHIHWGSAWLKEYFAREQLADREAELERVATLNDLMATVLQHDRLAASSLALANSLVTRLGCERVSVGFERHGRAELVAMSNAASFDRRSNLVNAICEAMDEALDLGVPLAVPAADDAAIAAVAHDAAARTLDVPCLMSVPVLHESQALGAITCERREGGAFTPGEMRLVGALGAMLGPYWLLLQQRERPWGQRARTTLRELGLATLGPRHGGLKLAGLLAALLLTAAASIEHDHRVAARTVIEGATQLAIVVPFDGFIAEAYVRAGDTVTAGQPLARLDGRDIALERQRWVAERDQLEREYQVAMAQADLGTLGVVRAQMAQSDARLALTEEKLERTVLTAPFDGIVLSGDLSQKLGVPVEKGELLFEVAPLEGYRVVLQVDDRDIAHVALEQGGELVLSSRPDHVMPFTVSAVTPVATQLDGRNVFRVEADLDAGEARLRPGMEGVGKIEVGRRSLLWIATHRFVDWLRLSLWNWMP
ncbi:MAG: efflux RND transporter periplasmic adaptor subunit [Gammaproteobacteria bacterium]